MKPRLFIACASGRLRVAHSIQSQLGQDYLTTIWEQGVFRASEYAIPSLLKRCHETDFALAIFGPDVVHRDANGVEYFSPNLNVLLELGLFMGSLGQDRVFVIAPSPGANQIAVPTDLAGLTVIPYELDREDGNFDAALGPTVHKVRRAVDLQWPEINKHHRPSLKVKLFNKFNDEFRQLVEGATEFEASFVHSRMWRETHGDVLRSRIVSGQLRKVRLYLPDIRDIEFIHQLASKFDDAPAIPGLIFDAFRWVVELGMSAGVDAKVYLYNKLPVYTFYISQQNGIIALYPLAAARKPVPAIEIGDLGEVREFLIRDIRDFQAECHDITIEEITSVNAEYKKRLGI